MNFVLHTVSINLSIVKESCLFKIYLFVSKSKELLDWQSSLKDECLMTEARCPSLLLSWSLKNVVHPLCYFFDLFVEFWINAGIPSGLQGSRRFPICKFVESYRHVQF